MHDAATGPHPVHGPWLGLLGAETVAVKNLPLEQVSHRSKVDVWMGTHVDALVGEELGRAHLVEKDDPTCQRGGSSITCPCQRVLAVEPRGRRPIRGELQANGGVGKASAAICAPPPAATF